MDQLRGARNAVFRSWNNARAKEYRRIYDIPDSIGTAVNVQMMVFGNTGDRSGTGVGFTRNPATGAKEFFGEFLINAQGEDVVAGIRTPQPIAELERVMPKAYKQLREITTRLERNYKDIQDFEFTIQDEKLYMLQTRSGKRTGYAAVVIATDFVKEKLVTPKEAILLVDPEALSQLLAPGFDPKEWKAHDTVTKGLPASPGAACGKAVFSSETAVEWSNKGEPVILVRRETVPDDIHGMWVSQGILTATGGMTSHAAVVGRQMGKPSIVGAGELRIDEHAKTFTVKGKTIKEGDYVAFDGLTGEVKLAKVASQPSEILQVVAGKMKASESPIYQRFNTLLGWTDKFRRLGVRANADQPDQAELAYAFGARGIGLCRTEHMFFGEGPHPDRAAHDPRGQRSRSSRRPQRAAADAARRLLRRLQGHEGHTGHDPHDRSAAPRVPAEARRPDGRDRGHGVEGPEGQGADRQEEPARARRAAARVQPDARPSRRASRHYLSRDHRNADSRDHGGRLQAEQGRPQGRAGDHDPARRRRARASRPEGDRRSRVRGGDQGDRRQDQVPRRHDDRGAARRADRR